MKNPLTFATQSIRFTEAFKTVNWCLHQDRVERSTIYFPEIFMHDRITDFRLCFYPGGRGPSRFGCYFKYGGEWNRKQAILSLTEQVDSQQYSDYYLFISTWIERVRVINPAVKIHTGLSHSMALFYGCLLGVAFAMPGFFSKQQLIDSEKTVWMYFVLFLLCRPIYLSLFYYFPSVLPHSTIIPAKVLPPPGNIKK